jgi:hypothetical protein
MAALAQPIARVLSSLPAADAGALAVVPVYAADTVRRRRDAASAVRWVR